MSAPIEAELHFFYDTTTPLSAKVVAEALLGLEGVLDNSRGVFGLVLHSQVREAKLLVHSIRSGSQDYGLWVRFILGKGPKAEKRIEEIRKFLKLDGMSASRLVSVVVALAVAYAAYKACSPEDPARIQIHNSFNTIGTEMGIDGEQALQLIEVLVTQNQKKGLKRSVSRLVHPTGEKSDGQITIGGPDGFHLGPEVVKAIPADTTPMEETDPLEDFDDEQVVIRALDLDYPSKGWSAIVPRLSDRRLPVHVAPGVDLRRLPPGRYFQADLTVVYSTDKHGNRQPKQLIIRRNCEDNDPLGTPIVAGP